MPARQQELIAAAQGDAKPGLAPGINQNRAADSRPNAKDRS